MKDVFRMVPMESVSQLDPCGLSWSHRREHTLARSSHKERISSRASFCTTWSSSAEVTVMKTMKPRLSRSHAIDLVIASCAEPAITMQLLELPAKDARAYSNEPIIRTNYFFASTVPSFPCFPLFHT